MPAQVFFQGTNLMLTTGAPGVAIELYIYYCLQIHLVSSSNYNSLFFADLSCRCTVWQLFIKLITNWANMIFRIFHIDPLDSYWGVQTCTTSLRVTTFAEIYQQQHQPWSVMNDQIYRRKFWCSKETFKSYRSIRGIGMYLGEEYLIKPNCQFNNIEHEEKSPS